MFSRNLYASLDLTTPRGPINPVGNVFDTAFNETMDMEEWNEWMKWEGGAELEFLGAGCKQSFEINVSSLDTWSTNVETAGRNTTLPALYSTANEFPLEDAPFKIDESTLSSNGLPTFLLDMLSSPIAQGPQTCQRSFHGVSTLTAAEEQRLQDIAMPYRMLSNIKIASELSSPTVLHSSPSPAPSPSPSPSPEPGSRTRKRLAKKRKSFAEEDEAPTALSQSRKRGHNAIEKRYRTNLNEKINCLRDGIPELSRKSSLESKTGDDEEGEESDEECMNSKTGQQKYGKAAILTRALEYICYLETTTQKLGGEVNVLKTRVGAFEKLAVNGSTILGGNCVSAISSPAIVKSESLESIQAGTFTLKTSLQKYTLISISRL
jgi:hypothetical protein